MTAGIDFDPAEREAIAAEMNISVLRRSDPAVTAILKSASHVALYELKGDSNWRRCDIEGSLFIVERRPDAEGATHRLVIFNRKSLHNYTDDLIVGNEKVEQADQMIMYHNSQSATVGIWFYETDEAAATFAILQKILNGEHVPAETTSKPKRPVKRTSPQQKASVAKAPTQKSPVQKSAPQKGSAPRATTQKGPAKRGPGHRGPNKGAAQKDQTQKDPGNKEHQQKGQAQKSSPKSKPGSGKQLKRNSPPQPSKAGIQVSETGNPLKQVFPNLQLPDGASERSIACSTAEAGASEAEPATTFKPTAEIDGAILHASETELPERALPDPVPVPKSNAITAGEKVFDEIMTAANCAQQASEGQSKEELTNVPEKAVLGQGKEPTPIVQPAQVTRAVQTPASAATVQQQKQMRQPQVKKRPKESPAASSERNAGMPSAKPNTVEARTPPERGVAQKPTSSQQKNPTAVPTSKELEEANRRMHAMMHDGRYRDMQQFRYSAPNDVGVSAGMQMMGSTLGAGVAPPGTQPLAPGHFPGVHPQVAMMMHQHQYQMYMQQQQYLANVHQRQLQNQNLSQSQQQHQRHYEHIQEMQRQAQQARQAQQLPVRGSSNAGVAGGNVDSHPKNEVESAKDLMRMLRVGETAGDANHPTLTGNPSEQQDDMSNVGRSIASAERMGQVGSSRTAKLDRPSFRAVLQRMLTDRKLFDCVYDHYLSDGQ